MDLKGKHILLTGGSLGIGKSTAKKLVDKGAKVLITGCNAERLKVASEYSGAEALVFDISDLDNITENAQKCLELLGGKVDALINNAGIGSFEKVEDINHEQFLEVFNTNVFFRLTHYYIVIFKLHPSVVLYKHIS